VNLTEKRRSLNMSLGECARAASMTTQELSKIERGRIDPSEVTCDAIGAVLGWTGAEVRASLPDKAELEKSAQRFNDVILAMGACHADAKARGYGKGHAGQGSIECPVCKGTLRYSVAGINGHLWGVCSNKDCVRWMQ
jgi:DNA-binding XRE family transcriptional regulator